MKYFILLASVLVQLCLGGLYAWSSFVPALHSTYGLSTAQTQFIFGVMVAMFAVMTVPAGRILERQGPRVVAAIGGILFGAGYWIASLSNGSLGVLLLGVGVVAGTGTGFGYVCPLATCMKWFPKQKGFVTGIAVAGFGGGAVLMSNLAEHLFTRQMDVLRIFWWIGITYGITIFLASLVLKYPVHPKTTAPRPFPKIGVMFKDPYFIALIVGMFSGTFAGLLVIGNLKPIGLSSGIPLAMAAAAVSVFAVGNATGRIGWGWVTDRLGERTVALSLGWLAVSLGILSLVKASPVGLLTVAFLMGCGFGACLIVYATMVALRYGADQFGSIYPIVLLAYGVAGISGPWIGGRLYDVTNSYISAIFVSIAVVVAGLLVCIWLLRKARSATGPGVK